MKIGNRDFQTHGHTYVMGILNVTPDSFSDGGKYRGLEEAIRQAKQMVEEGADIIDVGGESTRPGYVQISDQEEIDRVVPVIEQIKANLDVPISIDTYKPAVAQAAIQAGADMVNDIWGLKADGMAELIAQNKVPCCLMHNRNTNNAYLPNLKQAILEDMNETVRRAVNHGIAKETIILDPGIGFAKDTTQNLKVLKDEHFMMPEGFPILLGASRKSVIGNTLNLPTSERLEGTLVTTVLAAQRGCMFVRVHDVKENVRCIKMLEAIQKVQ